MQDVGKMSLKGATSKAHDFCRDTENVYSIVSVFIYI